MQSLSRLFSRNSRQAPTPTITADLQSDTTISTTPTPPIEPIELSTISTAPTTQATATPPINPVTPTATPAAVLSLDPEPAQGNTTQAPPPTQTPSQPRIVHRRFKTTQQLIQVYEELKAAKALPEEQKKLKDLMFELIREFKSQPKTRKIVAEIVPLARCSDVEIMQQTILELIRAIKEQPIGNQALLEGLAAAIVSIKGERYPTNNSSSDSTQNLIKDSKTKNLAKDLSNTPNNNLNNLIQGEIVAVVDILFERLENTHNDSKTQRPLMYAISEILEAMLLTNVSDLDRKKRESMHDSLLKLIESKDNEIAYYANISIQMLARTPDDETIEHGALRRSYALTCGILTLSGMVMKLEFEGQKITDVYNNFKEAFKLNPLKNSWYDTLMWVKSLLVILKQTTRTLTFERMKLNKQIEQTKTGITSQTTSEKEKLFNTIISVLLLDTQESEILKTVFSIIGKQLIEYEDCFEPVIARNFIFGCVRALVEASSWSENSDTHKNVTDYLKNLVLQINFFYRHQKFQELIIHEGILGLITLIQSPQSCEALSMTAHNKLSEIPALAFGLVDRKRSKYIEKSLATFLMREGVSHVSQLTHKLPDLDREPDGKLLNEARQRDKNFRIDLFIDRLRAQSQHYALETGLEKELSHYIPLNFKPSEKSQDTPKDLSNHFKTFATGTTRKILLLHGAAGAGKSLFVNKLENDYWDNYADFEDADHKTHVPLLIPLASLDDPTRNCVQQVLRGVGCQEADIVLMQQNVEFLFILDGYDEIRTTKNLFETNQLSKWKGNVIITCRTETLVGDYRNWFKAENKEKPVSYEEAYIMQFNTNDIENYLAKTHTLSAIPNSSQTTYETLKTMTGDLNALMTNPFILSIIVQIFERLKNRWQARGGTAGRVMNRAEVYEEFTEFWFEREERKLLKNANITVPSGFSLKEAFRAYSKDFAFQLFFHNKITVQGTDNQYLSKHMEEDPFTRFFATLEENRRTALSRMGSLVRRTGNRYGFIHKSLCEYFVAMSLWDELKQSECDSLESYWNKQSLKDEFSITDFLADCLKNYVGAQELLLNALSLTKSNKPQGRLLGKLGGNVMTVLHASKISFVKHFVLYPEFFTHLTIEKALLSHVNFDGIDFTGSHLIDCTISYSRFNNACFKNCDLRGLELGEFPHLKSNSPINAIAYRPDGKQLATGHKDGSVRLWDREHEEQPPVVLREHKGEVTSVAFSQYGKQLASGSDDKTIRLWNPRGDKNQTALVLYGNMDRITSVAFSPDGKQLVSGGYNNGVVHLWNYLEDENQPTLLPPCRWFGRSVAYSLDGKQLASGGGHYVSRWNLPGDEQVLVLCGNETMFVTSIAFSPDGKQLAAGSSDGIVRLCNPQVHATQQQSLVMLCGHKSEVTSVAFSLDGKQLASGSHDKTVRLWTLEGGTTQQVLVLQHVDAVYSVAFSPDGKQLASGSHDGTVRFWNPLGDATQQTLMSSCENQAGNFLQIAGLTHQTIPEAGHCLFNSVAIYLREDQQALRDRVANHLLLQINEKSEWSSLIEDSEQEGMTVEDYINSIRRKEWADYLEIRVLNSVLNRPIIIINNDGCIRAGQYIDLKNSENAIFVHYNEQDHYNAFLLKEGSLPRDILNRLLSQNQPKVPYPLKIQKSPLMLHGHTEKVRSVAFSPIGAQLVSGSEDTTVRLWTLEGDTIQQGLVLCEHERKVTSVAFSPDGKQLASGSEDNTVRLWNPRGDKNQIALVLAGHKGSVTSVAFSPDGKLASGSYDKTVRLWTLEGSATPQVLVLQHASDVLSVAFSPDGKQLAAGSDNGTVCLWNLQGNVAQQGLVLPGHKHGVISVAFSLDGKQLASGSNDNTVRLWNPRGDENQKALVLHGHVREVYTVVFLLNGKQLASASDDKTVRLWSLQGDALNVIRVPTTPVYCLTFIDTEGLHLVTGSYLGQLDWQQWNPKKMGINICHLISSTDPIALNAQACILDNTNISPQNRRLLIQNGAIESGTASALSSAQSSQTISSLAALATPESTVQQPLNSPFMMMGIETMAAHISSIARMSGIPEETVIDTFLKTNYPGRFFPSAPQAASLSTSAAEKPASSNTQGKSPS